MKDSPSLRRLEGHAERLASRPIRTLQAEDPSRARDFALRAGPLYANFARQRYDREALDALFGIAETLDLKDRLRELFDGAPVNVTENRAALHTALRGDVSSAPPARDARAQALAARKQMRTLVGKLEASNVTDIVSVGIGGSDLGPRLVVDALRGNANRFRVRFVSNVDPASAQATLRDLDPSRTAVLLISKSFGTQETLLNGRLLLDWLGCVDNVYAVTGNPDRAYQEFAIPPERVLPMWDWVGGRYSLWSSVGLPIALAAGIDGFESLLAGAAEIDRHVLHAPLRENVAVWHALTAVWNRNALGFGTHAVMPYAERLRLLPNYLQQLVMESLGKSVDVTGSAVACATVPVWWGGVGTDSQHSFFQTLHQGTQVVPMDLIGIADHGGGQEAGLAAIAANLLAQSEALANGRESDDPHRAYPGNRPSTILLLDALTPRSVGALLALYEHSVFLQGTIWGINPFDQFGVELGKQVAEQLLPALSGQIEAEDPVTRELLAQFKRG